MLAAAIALSSWPWPRSSRPGSPYDPGALRVIRRLRPPSELNWLGTDEFGRGGAPRASSSVPAPPSGSAPPWSPSRSSSAPPSASSPAFQASRPADHADGRCGHSPADILLAIFLVAILALLGLQRRLRAGHRLHAAGRAGRPRLGARGARATPSSRRPVRSAPRRHGSCSGTPG